MSQELAEKAAKLMKRNNAIIRACLLADPNPVRPKGKLEYFYGVCFSASTGEWTTVRFNIFGRESDLSLVHMYSKQKAEQVCELLTKWGVYEN